MAPRKGSSLDESYLKQIRKLDDIQRDNESYDDQIRQLFTFVVRVVGPIRWSGQTAGPSPMTKNRRKREQLILLEKPSTCCCLGSNPKVKQKK